MGDVILFSTKFEGRLPWVNDEKSSIKKKIVVLTRKTCNTTGREGHTLSFVVA